MWQHFHNISYFIEILINNIFPFHLLCLQTIIPDKHALMNLITETLLVIYVSLYQ